jgi:ADP-heptose:LPS heptosyltransferase
VALKPVTPIISDEARAWAKDIHGRYFKGKPLIFISPWACSTERTWPERYWAELVDGLLCYGHTIAGIRQQGRPWLDGVTWFEDSVFPADRTAAMFERCALVIGNDSGMVHVAGFVGTKGLAICGPTQGKTIFASYPSVSWVQSPYFCSGCLGLTRDYNPRWCKLGCNAMQNTPSKDVITKVLEMLR